MTAGEAEQALDYFLATLRALMNHREVALVAGIAVSALEQFRKTHHGGQGIVEFVRNAGDELTDAGEFFTLDELRLRCL